MIVDIQSKVEFFQKFLKQNSNRRAPVIVVSADDEKELCRKIADVIISNPNSLRLDYIDCDINTVANAVIRITSESIIKGKVPEDDNYIPIVHAQSNTNEYEVSIRYDYPSWIVYSNVSQALGIRFFKCTK